MAEEIIFRVGVDTGNAEAQTDKVTDALNDTNKSVVNLAKSTGNLSAKFDEVYGELQPLSARLGELEDRMYELALAGKQNTKEFIDLQEEAARFRKTIIAVDQSVDNLALKGQNMQAALQIGETVFAGYAAFQGITALVGSENEELTQTLVKLEAVQSILASTEQLRMLTEKNSLVSIKANALAQQLYTIAVGESTGALKIFRLALIATGIGAIIAGIILLVQNWDALTGAIGESSIATQALSETMEDYKKGAADATTETKKVKVAFDLAREGVISKDEALKLYNDTLGDSFGKAKDINEAEALYAAKTDAYIKATAMRRQADALLTKAAEEYANSLAATTEDQVGFWDAQIAGIQRQYGFIDASNKTLINSQKEGVKEQQALSNQRNDIFTREAERLLKEAELVENANGIKSESEQKLAEEKQKIADEAAKKAKEAADRAAEEEKKRAEEIKRLQREITDASIAAIEDRETRERMAMAEKHRREMEDLRTQYGERLDLIRLLEEKQAIEIRNFEAAQDDIRQAEIEAAKEKRKQDNSIEIQERSGLAKALLDISFKNAQDQKAIDDAVYESKKMLASNIASVIGQLAGLAKEGSNTQKALALTEIAINTAVGFVQGLRIAQQSAAAAGPAAAFAFPIFYAQQIGAVLAAAKQAKNILGSGASVSPPSMYSSSTGSAISSGSNSNQVASNTTTNTQTLNQTYTQIVLPIDSLKKIQEGSQKAEMVATLGG